jgi:hypothetical protein
MDAIYVQYLLQHNASVLACLREATGDDGPRRNRRPTDSQPTIIPAPESTEHALHWRMSPHSRCTHSRHTKNQTLTLLRAPLVRDRPDGEPGVNLLVTNVPPDNLELLPPATLWLDKVNEVNKAGLLELH